MAMATEEAGDSSEEDLDEEGGDQREVEDVFRGALLQVVDEVEDAGVPCRVDAVCAEHGAALALRLVRVVAVKPLQRRVACGNVHPDVKNDKCACLLDACTRLT